MLRERLVGRWELGSERRFVRGSLPVAVADWIEEVDGVAVLRARKFAERVAEGQYAGIGAGRKAPYPTDGVAACARGMEHAAPDPGCSCGFYALRDHERLPGGGRGTLLEVLLTGRVHVYEAYGTLLAVAERQHVVREVPRTGAAPAAVTPAVVARVKATPPPPTECESIEGFPSATQRQVRVEAAVPVPSYIPAAWTSERPPPPDPATAVPAITPVGPDSDDPGTRLRLPVAELLRCRVDADTIRIELPVREPEWRAGRVIAAPDRCVVAVGGAHVASGTR